MLNPLSPFGQVLSPKRTCKPATLVQLTKGVDDVGGPGRRRRKSAWSVEGCCTRLGCGRANGACSKSYSGCTADKVITLLGIARAADAIRLQGHVGGRRNVGMEMRWSVVIVLNGGIKVCACVKAG